MKADLKELHSLFLDLLVCCNNEGIDIHNDKGEELFNHNGKPFISITNMDEIDVEIDGVHIYSFCSHIVEGFENFTAQELFDYWLDGEVYFYKNVSSKIISEFKGK